MKLKKMFKIVVLTLISIFFPLISYSNNGLGIVTNLNGSASVRYGKEGKWEELKENDMVFVGDTIKTELDSHLLILLDDESTIEIGSLSIFTISEMSREFSSGKNRSKFNLDVGKIRLKVKNLMTQDSYYEVYTPSAVAGVRGTDFTVSHLEEEGSKIAVFEGEVEVKSIIKDYKETFKVKANQLIEVLKMKPPQKPKIMGPEEIEKMKTISLRIKDKLQKYEATLSSKGIFPYLQAKVRGIKEEKIEELFHAIKEDKITEDDAKTLIKGLDKNLLEKKDLEDTISIIKEKGLKSDEAKAVIEQLKDKISSEKVKETTENIKITEDKPFIPSTKQKDLKDLKEQIKVEQEKPTEDQHLREISKITEIIKNTLPQEYAQKLIEGLKNKFIKPEEAMTIVDAIKNGAKPEFIFEIFKELRNLKIDAELKKLIFAAIKFGLPPDNLKEVIIGLNAPTATTDIKEIKEKLKEYIKNNTPKKP